jgi:hypothetical protein
MHLSDEIKSNRYFNDRNYLRDRFYPLFQIKARFAILPIVVEKEWIWLKSYYSLYQLHAFRFGNTTNINYSVVARSLSIFAFKDILKSESIIKNLYRERIIQEQNFETMPQWLKDIIKDQKDPDTGTGI